jgi:hypothetical protein
MQRTQQAVPEARILGIHDDMAVQGAPGVAARVHKHRSGDGVRRAAAEPAKDAGQGEAGVVGVAFKPDGVVLAGSPVGTPEHTRERCAQVRTRTEKLAALPLSVQDTLLLLRMSMAHRLAAAAAKAGLQHDVDEDSSVMAAMAALLRHGGCGLSVGHSGFAGAAYLASAALAQRVALAGPAQFGPFAGPLRDRMATHYVTVFPVAKGILRVLRHDHIVDFALCVPRGRSVHQQTALHDGGPAGRRPERQQRREHAGAPLPDALRSRRAARDARMGATGDISTFKNGSSAWRTCKSYTPTQHRTVPPRRARTAWLQRSATQRRSCSTGGTATLTTT